MKKKKTKSSQKIGKKVVKKVKEPKVFDGGQGELDKALDYAWDIFNRAGVPICLLNEAARQLKDGEKLHQLEFIDIAVLDKHVRESGQKMLKTVIEGPWRVPNMNYKISKDLIEFFSEDGVPIKAKIIKKNTKYFENPDTVFYLAGEYRIPNSFKAYWKARKRIK